MSDKEASGAAEVSDRRLQPMYVRLPIEMHDAVKQQSMREDRTMAQMIRRAIRLYLEQVKG